MATERFLLAPLFALMCFTFTVMPERVVAQTAAQVAAEPLPFDPTVTTGTLDNGLRYFIRENRQPEKRAELRLVVNAGSILEDEEQRGLAHFVEHMAFNGTRNFEKQELIAYLESIGMRFGADLNAYTSFDETVYMLQVPTDSIEPMVQAMRILEDWAHGITFDPVEIDRERGVVIEEWRGGQGASERMRKQYFPTLFQNSRYSERLPIGLPEVLRTAPPEQLTRFYRDWYRPDLMAIVAVGDFDGALVEEMIREHFGRVPAREDARERRTYPVPDHVETLVAVATDVEATSTLVEVDWKLPPRDQGTIGAFHLSLSTRLYTRMLNARFQEITQKANSPFIAAGANYGSLIRTTDIHSLGANVADGGVERALEALLTEGERVLRHGFTETELEREKSNLLRGLERSFAERGNTESRAFAGQYVRSFLAEETIAGIELEFQLAQWLLPQIMVEEVNALAREWMTPESRVVIVMAPERARGDLPSEERILSVFDRVASAEVEPYIDTVNEDPLLANMPVPGRIVTSRPVEGLDATLLELSNGARVYLQPTDFKDDEILFGAFSPGGLSLVDDTDYASGAFAGQLIGLSGLGTMNAIELQRALTGQAVTVGAGSSDLGDIMNGSSSPKDIETLFQLVHLHFTGTRSDTVAFESFMMRIKAALANRDASPEAAFSDTFTLTLWQNHPRAQPQSLSFIEAIDQGRAYDIYLERFADAGDFTFVLVGAFDPEELHPFIETYLASLPSLGRVEKPRDTGMRPVQGVVEKVVRRGLEPKSQTRITFTGPFEQTPENRMAMSQMVSVLDMRLREVLREDLGGTYGVGINQSTQRFPEGRYTVNITFGADPDRLEELAETVFAEIEKIQRDGPDPEALGRVKEQQRRGHETNVRQNAYWRAILLNEAETGDPAAVALIYPERVAAVTAEQVQEAARRYLNRANYLRVSLVPEEVAATSAGGGRP